MLEDYYVTTRRMIEKECHEKGTKNNCNGRACCKKSVEEGVSGEYAFCVSPGDTKGARRR